MISRTKFEIDAATAAKIFDAAELGKIYDIAPLGAGEFNAVYSVAADGKEYALKIAPLPDTEVLGYEENMMRAEVYWYERMREDAGLNVPRVLFTDFTRTVIPSDYFIMEKLNGVQLDKMALTKAEKRDADARMALMAAKMHKVRGEKFGYIQNTLYDTWYQAVRAMTLSLIEACESKGRSCRNGRKLLGYIDLFKDVLEDVECRMVNFDIWDANIIAKRDEEGISYWWIDPERCFWGDRMADFVCLEVMKPLGKKTASLEAYNSVADVPVAVCRETEIRHAVLNAYMGVLQQTEKYFRYAPSMFGWWRNIFSGAAFTAAGFSVLRKWAKR